MSLRSVQSRNKQHEQRSKHQQLLDNEEGMRYLREDEQRSYKANGHMLYAADRSPLSWQNFLSVIIVVFCVKVAIRYEMHRMPTVPDPLSLGVQPGNTEKMLLDTDQFVASRARVHLNQLTKFGIRMAGTKAADENAVNWLLGELDDMRRQLGDKSPHSLVFSADHVSGAFELLFPSGYTSVFSNVSNVQARLDPVNGDTENALMLNCHFDSYFETVGASDDAVSCAIMLEMLRALMSSQTPLKHSVIFLFNGGEENILQASNGFIAGSSKAAGHAETGGHPWAKHIRAFINMEAAGSGGREILFQTGPGPATPILVRAYGESARYPFASVLGQEIFQSGIIPSDTDFRIFRDFGHIPGVDFAFYANGFVYHTPYDLPFRISDGSLEHAGSNILALIRTLASSDLSKMPPVHDPNDHSGEKLVYFDIFSSFIILYPYKTVGLLLNVLCIIGTFWRVKSLISSSSQREGSSYKKLLRLAIIAHAMTLFAAAATLFLIAGFLSKTSSCMSWYSKPWLLVPLYALPAAAMGFVVHAAFFKFYMLPKCTSTNFAQNCERTYDISFDAALIICSVGIAILSLLSIASSYVLCIWVGLPLIDALIMDRIFPLGLRQTRPTSGLVLMFRHAFVTFIPTVYFLYITDVVFELFIPILSRTGGHVNPEIFVAVLVLLTLAFLLLFHGSLVYLSGGHILPIIQGVGFFSGFILITVLLTPFGNPYSLTTSEVEGVHVQRSVSQLTMQRIIGAGNANEADAPIRSGIWFIPMDFNGLTPLRGQSDKLDQYLKIARLACSSEDDPSKHPYCGLPYFFPVTEFVGGKTYWMDVDATIETVKESYWPTVSQMPTSPRLVTAGRWLVQYRVDCGDTPQCSLYISPHSHTAMLKWHFSTNGGEVLPINDFPMDKMITPPSPTEKNEPRDVWFVMLRFGTSSTLTRLQQRSLIVTIELGASGHAAASGKNLLDVAIVSHYFRGSSSEKEFREVPVELRSFLTALPKWHFSIPVTSLYTSYSF